MFSFSERPEIADFCVSNFPQVSKVGIKSDGRQSPSNYGKSILIPICSKQYLTQLGKIAYKKLTKNLENQFCNIYLKWVSRLIFRNLTDFNGRRSLYPP